MHTGQRLLDIALGSDFLDVTPKTEATKAKISECEHIPVKTSAEHRNPATDEEARDRARGDSEDQVNQQHVCVTHANDSIPAKANSLRGKMGREGEEAVFQRTPAHGQQGPERPLSSPAIGARVR